LFKHTIEKFAGTYNLSGIAFFGPGLTAGYHNIAGPADKPAGPDFVPVHRKSKMTGGMPDL
jgi:hypothetical protein